MTLNEYQEKAMQTCMPSSNNFAYMMLNLMGEVGEFASKIAKAIRKEKMQIGHNVMDPVSGENDLVAISPDYCVGESFDLELQKEAGDIMWQIAGLCKIMNWDLEDICQQNLDKLKSRQDRGKIDGDGDNR